MTTPQLLPMLRPFAQAIAAQQERVPMAAGEARKLEAIAASRAWWVSGLTKQSLIKEAYREASRAIAEGLTKDEFLERLGTILDTNGGTLLSPARLELIAQNNHAIAYASGRYAQMRDPDIVALRPYWQYPLGPSDAHTSNICRKLEGFVARHDHPAWDHIYPPNHHNERHLQVLTLTEEQAKEIGIYEGPDYPKIDGQDQLPDAGWDMRPDLLGADEAAAAGRAVEVLDLIGAKTPGDYNLVAFSSVDVAELPTMPTAGLSEAEFRELFAIADGETATWYSTPLGSVRIDHAVIGETSAAIRSTLDDPFEAWWLYDAEGRTEFRFFGMFAGETGEPPLRLALRVSGEGRLTWSEHTGHDWTAVEAMRTGRLIRSGARRSS